MPFGFQSIRIIQASARVRQSQPDPWRHRSGKSQLRHPRFVLSPYNHSSADGLLARASDPSISLVDSCTAQKMVRICLSICICLSPGEQTLIFCLPEQVANGPQLTLKLGSRSMRTCPSLWYVAMYVISRNPRQRGHRRNWRQRQVSKLLGSTVIRCLPGIGR